MTSPRLCCACDATLDACVRWRGALPLLKLSSSSREALVPTGCSNKDVHAASPSIHSRRCIVARGAVSANFVFGTGRKNRRARRMVLRWYPSARSPRRA